MQISKLIPVVCVAAFCASFIAVRAEDTPAQAAARAALMEKMNTLEAQPAQPAQPQTVVAPSGVTQAQPSQPTNQTVVVGSNATFSVKASGTSPLSYQWNFNGTNTSGTTNTTPTLNNVQPAVPAPEMKPMPAPAAAPTTPAASDAEAQARARAALDQKMSELNHQDWTSPAVAPAASPAPQTQPVAVNPVKPAPPAVQPVVTAPAEPSNSNFSKTEGSGLQPIQAPPVPISAAKQAQLQVLLEKYKADQITPGQYHTERARILAEP